MSDLLHAGPEGLGLDYYKTSLVDMRLELPLGIHPWEHDPRRPQLVRLDIDLFWPRPKGFLPLTITDVVDYEKIRNDIQAWARFEHTKLIETLLDQLLDLCLRDPRVALARVRLAKIGVFNDVREAAVEAVRRRA
jgi:dihydroneopterin aldolase